MILNNRIFQKNECKHCGGITHIKKAHPISITNYQGIIAILVSITLLLILEIAKLKV